MKGLTCSITRQFSIHILSCHFPVPEKMITEVNLAHAFHLAARKRQIFQNCFHVSRTCESLAAEAAFIVEKKSEKKKEKVFLRKTKMGCE